MHSAQAISRTATVGFFAILALLSQSALCAGADVTSIWNNNAIGNWTSANWSSPNFPDNGNGGFTYDAAIGSGTVTLDQDITIEGLALSGGTLTGTSPFTLTINDSATWSGGTMSGTGQTIVAPGGTLVMNTSNFHFLSRLLVNQGSTTWTDGALRMIDGTFTNNGTFTANSNGTLDSYSGAAGTTNAFNNAGTFIKLGSGTAQFHNTNSPIAFNNSGSVDVQAGTLSLRSGGTNTGNFNVAPGAILSLSIDYQLLEGEVYVDQGAILDSIGGPLHVFGTSDEHKATLTNFGTITSDVVVAGGVLQGAGDIFGDLTLRGGYVRDTSGDESDIVVYGDLIIEEPDPDYAVWDRSYHHSGHLAVEGTTYVRDTFEVQTVLVGAPGGGSDLIIEDGGTLIMASARLGSPVFDRTIDVRIDEGGVLQAIGESAKIIGTLQNDGGTIIGDVEAEEVRFSGNTTNDGNIYAPGSINFDENATVNGNGTMISPEFLGDGTTSKKTKVQQPGALEVGQQKKVKPGSSPGRLTFTNPAADALTFALDDDPEDFRFEFEINNATGSMGMNPGWDAVIISNGGLVFEASSGAGMTIEVTSLIGNSTPGALLNFDPYSTYTWRFIDTALGFSGVPIEDITFLIEDSQFAAANGIPIGRFSVIQDTPLSLALEFAPLLLGDYDQDDEVDADDYLTWKAAYGTNDMRADGNRDGVVDAADYTVWRNALSGAAIHSPGSGGIAGVPEPTSLLLMVIGLAMNRMLARRQR